VSEMSYMFLGVVAEVVMIVLGLGIVFVPISFISGSCGVNVSSQ
jgi:hypothetical protein